MRLFLCTILLLSMPGPVLAAAPSEKELKNLNKPMAIQGGEVRPDRSVSELGIGGANNPPSDPPPKKGSRTIPALDGVQGKDLGIRQAPAPIPVPPQPDPPDDPEMNDALLKQGLKRN